MTKHKHHYVWQYYLKAWAADGQVWCARQGRVFRTSTVNVGQERDFYRLQELSAADLEFMERAFIARAHPAFADIARGWIAPLHLVFGAKRLCEASGLLTAAESAIFEEAINDTEENLHSAIEGLAVAHFEQLRRGDLSFLADEKDCIQLIFFLCLQYLRTPKMREGILAAVPPDPRFNPAAAMGLLRLVIATKLAGSFYFQRASARLSLLRAPIDCSFITTDQPVVNSKGYRTPVGQAPEELEFFYPVSPQYALVLTPRSDQPGTALVESSQAEVSRLNAMMVAMSREQVYAAAEIDLAALGLGVGAPASEPK